MAQKSAKQPAKMKAAPPAPKGGIIDNMAEKAFADLVQRHWSVPACRMKIDKMLAYGEGNPVLDLIDSFVEGKEDAAAQIMSDLLAIGTDSDGMHAEATGSFARRNAKNRLIRHLRRQKGMSRDEAIAKADSLTDEQYDKAIGELPAQAGLDPSSWFAAILAFIEQYWPQILAALLALLML